MTEATLIYPHQLFKEHPGIQPGRPIYLIEEPLFFTEFPAHRQKLMLHRLSMQSYYAELVSAGYTVTYLSVLETPTTQAVFERIHADGIRTLHITDVTDFWLSKRIDVAQQTHSFVVHHYTSPLFILSKEDAQARYRASKKHMARFYKKLRTDRKILLTPDGDPIGGQWSFDTENRQKLPKHMVLPEDPQPLTSPDIDAAKMWLTTLPGEHYGEAMQWLPYSHDTAEVWFREFLQNRFEYFGTYEDAIDASHVRLFHSALSPLINIGLLAPEYVLHETLLYAQTHAIPINSLEGFVRQILGWREFIRAAYECDGVVMRTKNFWHHTRPMPVSFWDGTTGLIPVDDSIQRALRYGYTHHIERLMILGNAMLLSEVHPDQVYRWFMALYVDAYDWVMVPNVYSMSQFSDGGIFATKPYISGSNYIQKMSSYPHGDWEKIWTALYWHFIEKNEDFFSKNHRLSMMPRLLEKMDPEKRNDYRALAQNYLTEKKP